MIHNGMTLFFRFSAQSLPPHRLRRSMSHQIQRPCDKHQLQSAKLDDFKEVAKEDSVSQALVCTRIT